MIVDWLNDSLIFRAETTDERHSLAAVLRGIADHEQLEPTVPSVEMKIKCPSSV
jgi:hypothetical protein